MKAKHSVALLGIAGGLMLGAQAQATQMVVIDDWNIGPNESTVAEDDVADGNGVTVNRTALGGTYWGSRDDLYANLVVGDETTTEDCANCQQGHGTNASNSIGHGYWSWSGGPQDFVGGVSLFAEA